MRFNAQVFEMIQRTSDVLSIRFERPSDLDYLPGQFMFVDLMVGERTLRKHFTLSSSPSECEFIEITKRLTGHEFSNALAALNVGDVVSLEAPFGKFTLERLFKKTLFLTGGIGITPIRSMIRYATDTHYETEMILLYSCRDEDNIPFREEFEELQNINPRLKVYNTLTRPESNWDGLVGRITGEMIQRVAPDYYDRVSFVSGPINMVNHMLSILTNDLKLPKNKVKYEYFPGFKQENQLTNDQTAEAA
jgi:ferredoxin-NADP reductase